MQHADVVPAVLLDVVAFDDLRWMLVHRQPAEAVYLSVDVRKCEIRLREQHRSFRHPDVVVIVVLEELFPHHLVFVVLHRIVVVVLAHRLVIHVVATGDEDLVVVGYHTGRRFDIVPGGATFVVEIVHAVRLARQRIVAVDAGFLLVDAADHQDAMFRFDHPRSEERREDALLVINVRVDVEIDELGEQFLALWALLNQQIGDDRLLDVARPHESKPHARQQPRHVTQTRRLIKLDPSHQRLVNRLLLIDVQLVRRNQLLDFIVRQIHELVALADFGEVFLDVFPCLRLQLAARVYVREAVHADAVTHV